MDGGASLYIAAASAAATLAATGVSAYSQFQSAEQQAAVGQRQSQMNTQAALMQAEQARISRMAMLTQVDQAELEAVEQENERQRRAQGVEGANRALAAMMGFDPDTSGSYLSLSAENRRIAEADIGSIRLLGRARALQFTGQAAGSATQEWGLLNRAEMGRVEGAAFRAMGDNAWIGPSATLLRGASDAWRSSPFSMSASRSTGGGSGGAPKPSRSASMTGGSA
jgi:hypothetical protein